MLLHIIYRGLFILTLTSLTYTKIISSFRKNLSPTQKVDADPFDHVAQFLTRFGKGSDFERYKVEEVSRALKALSKSQSALKSMDGATHQFKNVFKESSSLGSRYAKFVATKSRKLKEAAKVHEYTRAVERGLQATEILQGTSTNDDSLRSKYLQDAGLVEIKRVTVVVNKVKCTVSVLRPLIDAEASTTAVNPGSGSIVTSAHTNTSTPDTKDASITAETTSTNTSTSRSGGKAARAEERRRRSEPQRFYPGELIVAITDHTSTTTTSSSSGSDAKKKETGSASATVSASASTGTATSVARLLRLVTREPPAAAARLPLPTNNNNDNNDRDNRGNQNSHANSGDSISRSLDSNTYDADASIADNNGLFSAVQPSLLALSCKVIQEIREFIILPPTCTTITTTTDIDTASGSTPTTYPPPPTSPEAVLAAVDTSAPRKKSNNNHATTNVASILRSNTLKDSIVLARKSNTGASTSNVVGDANNSKSSSREADISCSDCASPSVSGATDKSSNESNAGPGFTDVTLNEDSAESSNISARVSRVVSRVRVIGHSAGGAVAALTSMLLEGAGLEALEGLNTRGRIDGGIDVPNKGMGKSPTTTTTPAPTLDADMMALLDSVKDCFGQYSNRVQCLTLGSPPCVDRAQIPRYISSFVCGDDIVPRAQVGALRELRARVLKALKAGAGKGGIGYMLSAGLLSDLTSIAGKSLGHYKGKSSAADPKQLSVPGRVFFVKPRKLKEGATIQRVLRGNWQEDVLWQLHDVLLSKRMLEHHSLDSYIRTLNRSFHQLFRNIGTYGTKILNLVQQLNVTKQ